MSRCWRVRARQSPEAYSMANAILTFPRQRTRSADSLPPQPADSLSPQPAAGDLSPPRAVTELAKDADRAIPIHELWRRLPAEVFGEAERRALWDLLVTVRPLRVEHWREALGGDDSAAVAMALKLSGIDVLDTHRHDLVLSMLLWHALGGSATARSVLAFTLDRRRYLGEDVEALTRSWRGPSCTDGRLAAVRALMEALS
jgi:hypothetical protein